MQTGFHDTLRTKTVVQNRFSRRGKKLSSGFLFEIKIFAFALCPAKDEGKKDTIRGSIGI